MPDIDYFKMIISFFGGLGLFIYGMHTMASGLQKSAGSGMKKLLERFTRSKFLGILMGAGLTAIIQSSSATTVMIVGFVNAGLMSIGQTVGVIMGANIGTTVTGWLISSIEWTKYFSPSHIAPLVVGIGAIMSLFAKRDKAREIGQILFGFGLLFTGMNFMSSAVNPLKELEAFKELFRTLGSNPFLGVLAGTLVTCIIQSSSASIGILQSLALAGLVPWNAAIYIIMGQNIGTCITALISGIGASKAAKSAAYIHLLFNVIGSIVFSILAAIYFQFINPSFGNNIIHITEIAIAHTAFNIANTIMFYPFGNVLVNLAKKLASYKETEEKENMLIQLDDRILETPTLAIDNCMEEITTAARCSLDCLVTATEALVEKSRAKADIVFETENNIDAITQAITNYMIKLCSTEISTAQNRAVTAMFHTVNDVERIGDHCENIAELAIYMMDNDLNFSDIAHEELEEIVRMTRTCLESSINSLEKGDEIIAELVLAQEKNIDALEKQFRASHISRLSNNECNCEVGVIFLDTISNLERISDHAQNIAETVIAKKTTSHKNNKNKLQESIAK